MTEISLIFATIALTYALTESEGAFGSLKWLRTKTARLGLLQCGLCTSFWVALVLCVVFQRLDMMFICWGAFVVFDKISSAYITRG